jgi:hypothetical protein
MFMLRSWPFCLALLFSSISAAADPPPPVEAPAQATPKPDEPTLREQTIYVPYSKLPKVFEQPGRGVFLPYEEFQKLWEQARAALAKPPEVKPPVAALITEINSEATVGDEVVNVTASLKIELLTEGWHEVPLRLGDAAILSARQGNAPARIAAEPDVGYVLLLQKKTSEPEQVAVTLQYSKAFTKSPGQNVVSFQAPQSPVNQWRIRVPQAGVKVNVQPLVAATEEPPPDAPADGAPPPKPETVVMAFVGAAPSVQIDWTPKAEGAMGLTALATVQTEQQVSIDEGVVRTRAQLVYTISRAELAELAIEVPANQKVLNVFDPNVKEWKVEQAGDTSKITIQLYQPARETQRLLVEMEKFSDDLLQKPIAAPVVRALGVGRQQGVVVVQVAATLRAEPATRIGLLQLDANELPPTLANTPWNFSFRFPAVPFELTLRAEKVQPQIQTHELVEAYLEPERLTLDLLALYKIERASVFQLELDVPLGFEVRAVRGHAAAGAEAVVVDTHHITAGEKSQHVVVNLARKAIGHVGLFVELQRQLEAPNLLSFTGESSAVPLPLPRVSAAKEIERSVGRLLVYAPENLSINPVKTDGVQTLSFVEALQDTASTRDGRFGPAREVLAYAYTQAPVDLNLAVERRKPDVTVRQLLLARVEAGVIKYEATFFYEIRYSSVKSLRLDVPAALVTAKQLRNLTPAVASEAPLDPQPDDVQKEGPDAKIALELTRKGESEFLGNVTIKFAWDKKIGDLPVGKPFEETVPVLQPHKKSVDRAWGQVVVAKAETLDLRPKDDPVGLRPIDPQHDLMPGVSVADAARAWEFYEDWQLKLSVTRYELVEVKRGSIERAVIRMEVTRSGVLSVQALYRLRSVLQRLPVVLPRDVSFDTDPLRINGRSVALESEEPTGGLNTGSADARASDTPAPRDQASATAGGAEGTADAPSAGGREYYIPLAGHKADESLLLELRYTMPGSHHRLDLPVFPSNPAVQKVYLCAYVPQERKVLGSRGPWSDEMSWRWYETLSGLPQPIQRDDQLVAWVIEGLNVPNPFQDFATDGRLYTFSTLQPAKPPGGSLRLVAVHKYLLHGLVFALVLAVGLLAIRRPLPQKFAIIVLLVMVLLAIGVFAPAFARQIMDGALLTAILIVAAAWSAWHMTQAWSLLSAAWVQRRAARAAAPPSPPAAPPPAPAATPAVESPFATQEGGPSNA